MNGRLYVMLGFIMSGSGYGSSASASVSKVFKGIAATSKPAVAHRAPRLGYRLLSISPENITTSHRRLCQDSKPPLSTNLYSSNYTRRDELKKFGIFLAIYTGSVTGSIIAGAGFMWGITAIDEANRKT